MSLVLNGLPGLQGVQEPRISRIPAYASTSGDEAVELARMAGLILDPWQQTVLRHSLGETADDRWAAFEVGLVVARQNGKNAILEAREIAGLFLLGEQLIIHSAHQFDTSIEHFRRLEARIKNAPELMARVKKISHAHGHEGIELHSGQRILFAARTKGGRRGFTADCLIFDESMDLPEEVVGAVMPTLSTRPNPQIWYTGSAVDQQKHDHGLVLARIRQRGVSGEGSSLAYFEWSAPDDASLADRESWAQANPGLGIRITEEYVAQELESMPAREFRTERQGIGDWPSTDPDAGRVISQLAWTVLADPSSLIDDKGRVTFAIDVDPDQSWATLAAAGQRPDGLWHVGVVEHRRGTGWLVEKAEYWMRRREGSQLVIDPRNVISGILQDFEQAGIPYVRMNANDYAAACSGFFEAVLEKRLRYRPPQPELDAAVAGARTKPLLDAWKWDRPNSAALITPLVACTNALWGARTQLAPQIHDLSEIAGRFGIAPPAPFGAPGVMRPDGSRFVPLT